MFSRRAVRTALAALAVQFALSAAPADAQTRQSTLAQDYVVNKLKERNSNVEPSAVMRLVGNVFTFQIRSPAQFKQTWEKAADAVIDLAVTKRATFDLLDCYARSSFTLNPFVVKSPKYDFKAKINEIAAPNSAWQRSRAPSVEGPGGTRCSASL